MSYQSTQALSGTGTRMLGTATDVLSDPCLLEVIGNSRRLYSAIEAMKKAEPAPSTPTKPEVGVGLCALNKPLRTAVYAAEHPWVIPVTVSALVGTFILIGFVSGRRSMRKK